MFTNKKSRSGIVTTLILILSLLLTSCQFPGRAMPDGTTSAMAEMATDEVMQDEGMQDEAMMSEEMVMSAGDLRVTLDQLLGEHVLLAASATGAALGGRADEFEAAAAALDMNSVDLAGAIGLVYGPDAQDAFLGLWRTHIGFFVDYTTAVATGDEAAKQRARDALAGYGPDFGAFLASANPNITKEAIAEALVPHVATLTAAIDAQAAGDGVAAFTALREAYAHMDMIAATLAGAISAQFPERFPGDANDAAAGLHVALTTLLSEHTYLAAMATNGAVGGRGAEFQAAAAALDLNSIDLAAAVGSVYGDAAGEAFLSLWRTHIGFFVDYTVAVAGSDIPSKATALSDLAGYANDFGAFLESANPNLTKAAVAEALGPHVGTLTAVIDAQAVGDYPLAYTNLRTAYGHMRMIADALSHAIVMQFPDTFGMGMGMDMGKDMAMDGDMMDHGAMDEMAEEPEAMTDDTMMADEMVMSADALRATLDRLLGEHVLLASSATEAALRGRQAEFEVATSALDGNSVDIAALIGAVYGPDAEAAFLGLWRTHIGFFVDYTTGLALGDQAMQAQALADLDGYAEDFGAFMESANPFLPQAAVAAALRSHVTTLVAVIDAQATATPQKSGDQQKAYPALRMAYAHMDMEATAIAGALAQQFPKLFPGEVASSTADVRSGLNMLLAEHAFLVVKSADAAIQARTVEFEAAAAALDANSVDLAGAVTSVYGDGAGEAFLALWRRHIGFFTDYELAIINGNQKDKDAALAELIGYADDFGAFLSSANPQLPADVVAELVRGHAGTTITAIDAAAEEQYVMMYDALRSAYGHMQMIANPLTDAIAAQFPDRFPPVAMMDEAAMAEAAPVAMPAPEMPVAPAAPATLTGETVELTIDTFIFTPQMIEVPVGTTVVWTNMDAIDHTVTAGAPGAETGIFDSGFFNQGESFSYTFTEVGDYSYFCQRHPNMRGMVVVVAQ